jgi:hypothetical protein
MDSSHGIGAGESAFIVHCDMVPLDHENHRDADSNDAAAGFLSSWSFLGHVAVLCAADAMFCPGTLRGH